MMNCDWNTLQKGTTTNVDQTNPNKWLILTVVTLVAFITNVDSTIVIVGLPKLMEGLHVAIATGLWMVTSYIITSTVFLLPAGRWSDIVGAKRIFMLGLLIFTGSTVLCGLASTGTALVVFRFIQGVGAALALATGVPMIVRTFPQRELGRALGINSTSWVIGSIVGPIAGGALINVYGWRSVFFVTVPFAVMGILMAAVVLPSTSQKIKMKTDWLGIVTFGGCLVALLTSLSQGQAWGWSSTRTFAFFSATIILFLLFVAIERRVKHPVFNLNMLSNGQFSTGLAVTVTYSVGYYATTFLLTLYLQGALQLNPLYAGLMLIPLSLPQLVMGPIGGFMSDRFGTVPLIVFGLLLLAMGDLILGSLGPHLSMGKVIIPQIIMSVATGLSWPALQKATLSGVPQDQAGAASGMFYTLRNVGMSLSLTLALVVAELSVSPTVASQAFLGASSALNLHVKNALVHSADVGFRVFVLCFVASLILSVFFVWSPRPDKTSVRHKSRRGNAR